MRKRAGQADLLPVATSLLSLTEEYLVIQLLADPDFARQALPKLKREFFADPTMGKICEAMKSLPTITREHLLTGLDGILKVDKSTKEYQDTYSAISGWHLEKANGDWLRKATDHFVQNRGSISEIESLLTAEAQGNLSIEERKLHLQRSLAALDVSAFGESGNTQHHSVRQTLDAVKNSIPPMPDWNIKNVIAPRALTLAAAPTGCGKTMWSQVMEYALTHSGIWLEEPISKRNVYHYNFDMPDIKMIERYQSFGFDFENSLFKFVRREDCKQLDDFDFWEALPIEEGDVLVVDSLGSATANLGLKDDRKWKQVFRTVLSLCGRGASFLVLHNTTGNAKKGKGIQEIFDRIDLYFEIRDATQFTPTGKKHWLEELVEVNKSGAEDWAALKTRRTGKSEFRLALSEVKSRYCDIPPMVLEFSTATNPWSMKNVSHEFTPEAIWFSKAKQEANKSQGMPKEKKAANTFKPSVPISEGSMTGQDGDLSDRGRLHGKLIDPDTNIAEKAMALLDLVFIDRERIRKSEIIFEGEKYGIQAKRVEEAKHKKHLRSEIIQEGKVRDAWWFYDKTISRTGDYPADQPGDQKPSPEGSPETTGTGYSHSKTGDGLEQDVLVSDPVHHGLAQDSLEEKDLRR